MKIGLDFDGVISDCGKLKSEHAKQLYGIDIPAQRFKKEIVIREGYLTPDQFHKLQKEIYETREIGLRMEPVAGALRFISLLIFERHEIRVVTSRELERLDIAEEWLWRYGIILPLIGVGHSNTKAEAARGLDFYVDDDFDKLEPLVGIVPHLYLFSWGYNAEIDPGSAIKRIASWIELYAAIHQIEKVQ